MLNPPLPATRNDRIALALRIAETRRYVVDLDQPTQIGLTLSWGPDWSTTRALAEGVASLLAAAGFAVSHGTPIRGVGTWQIVHVSVDVEIAP